MKKLNLALALALTCGSASADVITQTDFSDTSQLVFNNDAMTINTAEGEILRLTPALEQKKGTVFSRIKVSTAKFSTFFKFRITEPGGWGPGGSDGFAFVVQAYSPNIAGGRGGGLGYYGIPQSFAVEFDTWDNTGFSDPNVDPDSNHIGVDYKPIGMNQVFFISTASVATPFKNGDIWSVWIDYDGNQLEVRLNTTGERPSEPLLTQVIDIHEIMGGSLAYVGFTAGTGAAYQNHDILTWSYQSEDVGLCKIYAVHDEGRNDSQVLTISPDTFQVDTLGDFKMAHDLEALAIHPQTGELYAASGRHTRKKGYLYKIDRITGELAEIGSTGKVEVDGLAFAPDGTLWGWAQDVGLLIINHDTGEATVVVEYPGEIEALTWNNAGTILYGVENLHKHDDGGVLLWAYNTRTGTVETICNELTSTLEIEALETLPDDSLLFGFHGENNLLLGAIEPSSCQIIAKKEIPIHYNDIEGLALQDCHP